MKTMQYCIEKPLDSMISAQFHDVFCDHLHHHDVLQISTVDHTEGSFLVEDYKGNFSSNDIIIIGTGQNHVFKPKNNSGEARMYSIFVDLKLFEEHYHNIPEFQKTISILRHINLVGAFIQKTQSKGLPLLIKEIVRANGFNQLLKVFELFHELTILENYVPLAHAVSIRCRANFDAERLEKIFNYTKQNIGRLIKLEEIAQVAYLTPESFCKYFKSRTGKTYIQYVNELRVSIAIRHLVFAKLNLSEISSKVGFSNVSYFNKIFKKVKGHSPKQYLETI